MFYHVVMMRYSDRADAGFHRRVRAYADRIRGECGGIVHYDYGANVADRGKGYDWVIAGVFESSAAHDAYQASAPHQEMKAFMMPCIADLVVCDLDVPQPAPIPAAGSGS
jgi:hypothetical protein